MYSMGLLNAKNLSDGTASTLWGITNRLSRPKENRVCKADVQIECLPLSVMHFGNAAKAVIHLCCLNYRVWQKNYANHLETINDIADYIVGFYNSTRMHSKLGNLLPNAFERESTSNKTYPTVRNYLTTTVIAGITLWWSASS